MAKKTTPKQNKRLSELLLNTEIKEIAKPDILENEKEHNLG